MNDEHSVISPSGFYRMMACPGSVEARLEAPFQEPSIYAIRGTLQHEAVVLRWNGKSIKKLKLEQDEVNNVDDAIDYLRDLTADTDHTLTMEARGDLGFMGYPDIWGTRDVDLYFDSSYELHVIDWKFGSGVAVEVEDNPQLLGYLLMALGTLDEPGFDMYIHLVQPPKNYYQSQKITHSEVVEFADKLDRAIQATKQSNAPRVPGEKQCQFCPAAMTCKARYNMNLQTAHDVFDFLEKKSSIVTPEQNSEMYTKLEQLIKYHAELGKHGYKELLGGREFPGYKLVSGRSTREWANEKTAIPWLMKYGKFKKSALYTKPKLLSPAQIEKANRSLKKDDDFKLLVDKPPGKPNMVPADDKRKAYDINAMAKDVFDNL